MHETKINQICKNEWNQYKPVLQYEWNQDNSVFTVRKCRQLQICYEVRGDDIHEESMAMAYLPIQAKLITCNKTCVKWLLSKRQQIGFQYQLSLNAGQKYRRMHHSLSYHFSWRSLFSLCWVVVLHKFYCSCILSLCILDPRMKCQSYQLSLFPYEVMLKPLTLRRYMGLVVPFTCLV